MTTVRESLSFVTFGLDLVLALATALFVFVGLNSKDAALGTFP